VSVPVTHAVLAIQRGETARALDALEAVKPYEHAPSAEFWPTYLRGQAYLQAKDGRAAATEFESILAHRGEVPASPLYPLAHLGLARAAAMVSDVERARKEYGEMLALWKDADANLQALKAARLEYARLTPTS
jgi:predicted Zn-dependent protease